jgi:prepilin peptidase CpaA
VSYVALYLVIGLLAWAAFTDVRDYLIPNRICAGIAALFPIHIFATGQWSALWPGLFVGLVVLAIGYMLFARGLLGGGDVKLSAAVALWAGPPLVLQFIFVTGVAGGVISLAMLAPRLFSRHGALFAGPPVPYGVAIAAGGLYVASRLLAGM